MDYITRIKQIKSERRITNDELSEMTGIPLGTLSKILAGISDSPKLSNMVAICAALGCTLDYIVAGTPENNNNYTLSDGEIKLIENFRMLDTHGKEMVTLVLDKECDRARSEQYSSASHKKAKVLSLPERRMAQAPSAQMPYGLGKRDIPLYDMPVSAGLGVFLDDSMAEDISIPDNFKTKGADFAVRISGHSMEPRYRDGDVLLVQECESVENGELGIFVLDGSGYFKIFGGDRLISINPDFADIPLSDFGEAACCGKVIGKLRKK